MLIVITCFQTPVDAKARLVAVVVFRSSVELQPSAQALSSRVASLLNQEPGWEAKVVQANGAATAGAEIAVIGQLLKDANGTRLLLASFRVATDERLNGMTVALNGMTLPENANLSALLGTSAASNGALPQVAIADPTPAPSLQTVVADATPRPTPNPSAVRQVLIPRGTIIVVKTTHGLNSYGQESGTKLVYEVVQDVVVDGFLIAQAGDVAEGVVQDSQAGENNLLSVKAANLRISVDSVFNFCGDTIHMDFQRSEFRQRQGVFGSHKDVEIVKGQMYQVPTERPQRVCGTKTTESPLPIPDGALPGDNN